MRALRDLFFRRISLVHIVLLGILLRGFGLVTASVIDIDGTVYARMGESFARGDFAQGLRGAFPPVFPFLIGLFHLVVPDIELAGRLVSFVFGVLLIYVFFLFAKRFLDEKQALWGAFFVAIHPYLVKPSFQVLSESVAIFLFAVAIFLFYKGWTEDRSTDVALSGIVLGLTYLTRPEYIVFFAPMGLMLLWKKKFIRTLVFLCCFFAFVLAYMYYMKMETGLIVVSKKAILAKSQPVTGASHHSYLLPFLPIALVLKHIPSVLLNFMKAQFVPFFILAIVGFRAVDRRYNILIMSLVVVHVLSIATISASTVRFSIEFIPLMVPFAVVGLSIFSRYSERIRHGWFLYAAAVFILIGSSLVFGYSAPNKGRDIHKQAGLYLKNVDPGKVVASRLPFAAFYSHGTWVVLPERRKCMKLVDIAKNEGARYVVLDYTHEKNLEWSDECQRNLKLVKEIRSGEDFVVIYRVNDG